MRTSVRGVGGWLGEFSLAKMYGGTVSSWLAAGLKPKLLMMELREGFGENERETKERGAREEERDTVD